MVCEKFRWTVKLVKLLFHSSLRCVMTAPMISSAKTKQSRLSSFLNVTSTTSHAQKQLNPLLTRPRENFIICLSNASY